MKVKITLLMRHAANFFKKQGEGNFILSRWVVSVKILKRGKH